MNKIPKCYYKKLIPKKNIKVNQKLKKEIFCDNMKMKIISYKTITRNFGKDITNFSKNSKNKQRINLNFNKNNSNKKSLSYNEKVSIFIFKFMYLKRKIKILVLIPIILVILIIFIILIVNQMGIIFQINV